MFTATTPVFTVVIAWLWLTEELSGMRVAGLAVGSAGVLWLVWDKASLKHGVDDASTVWAIVVRLMETLLYGFSANISKQHLGNVSPLVIATGN